MTRQICRLMTRQICRVESPLRHQALTLYLALHKIDQGAHRNVQLIQSLTRTRRKRHDL